MAGTESEQTRGSAATTAPTVAIVGLLLVVAVVGRLVPYPSNVTPVAAAVMFAAVFCRRATAGVGFAIAAMLVSDIVLGLYHLGAMACVYAGIAVPALLGAAIDRPTVVGVATRAVAGSVAFFLISNAGVWACFNMYPHTSGGLLACYAAGLPFFRATLVGDLVWSGLFFGAFAYATRAIPAASEWRAAAGPAPASTADAA